MELEGFGLFVKDIVKMVEFYTNVLGFEIEYKKGQDNYLKKITKESIFFKNTISCCNSTDPSITSLFTAKYPPNNGIIHQFPHTKDSEIKKFKRQKQFWFPSYLKKISNKW